MATYTFGARSDADVLTALQAISSKVTAYSKPAALHLVTTNADFTNEEQTKVGKYLTDLSLSEWVET